MMAGVAHVLEGDLLEITLTRPARRNALGEEEWSALERLLDEAAASETCQIIALTGEGDFFCSGVDLALLKEASADGQDPMGLFESNNRVLRKLADLPQLLIVALNGPAIGVGMHLALMGDVVVAQENAYFWLPEAKLGIPDVLHYRLLEERLGRTGALSMVLLGQRLLARQALERGLIGEVVVDTSDLRKRLDETVTAFRRLPVDVRRAIKAYLLRTTANADTYGQIEAMRRVGGKEG